MSQADSAFVARCRELGASRLAFVEEMQQGKKSVEDWPEPAHGFELEFGSCWNATLVYGASDYVAELGFWAELLGFGLNAVMSDYAMLMPPERDFFFSIVPASEEHPPVQGLQVEFMVKDMDATLRMLEERGMPIQRGAWRPWGDENPMQCALLETPCGVGVKLWCFPE